MISFEHVAKRYPGGIQALSDVNFALHKGELAFLTGPFRRGQIHLTAPDRPTRTSQPRPGVV